MIEQKQKALAKLANRVTRLVRLGKIGAPDEVIEKEKQLIRDLFESGEIHPREDHDDIRLSILQHVAMMIANDHFERIGALGNTCLHCARFGSTCEKVFPEGEADQIDWADMKSSCGDFIKQIEPSKAGEYESILIDLHDTYGIDKDRDLPIVRAAAERMKARRDSRP